jgi:hypothetical protein
MRTFPDFQVLGAVVGAISVAVMDSLASLQGSPQHLCRNHSMLRFPDRIFDANVDVASMSLEPPFSIFQWRCVQLGILGCPHVVAKVAHRLTACVRTVKRLTCATFKVCAADGAYTVHYGNDSNAL